MSNADQIKLAYVEETTFGEFPSSPAPTLTELRTTGETFNQETDSSQSNEIRSDRQVSDVYRSAIRVSGDLNFELSYEEYDYFLEAALQSSDWSTSTAVITSDTDVSAAASTDTFTLGTGSWSNTPSVGDIILVTGATETDNNNGFFTVTAATSTTITVDASLADETAGATITITVPAQITNGTEQRSFSFEREYSDLSSEFATFTGMTIASMSLSIEAGAAVTGTFSFMGKDEDSASATSGDGTNTSSTTNEPMNGVDNIDRILVGGVAASKPMSLSLSLENGLRERNVIGELGPDSFGAGRCIVTGSLSLYYASKTDADRHLNFTDTSLFFSMIDTDGNRYVVSLPRVNITASPRNAGGTGEDIVMELSFSAFRHSTYDYTIRIARA